MLCCNRFSFPSQAPQALHDSAALYCSKLRANKKGLLIIPSSSFFSSCVEENEQTADPRQQETEMIRIPLSNLGSLVEDAQRAALEHSPVLAIRAVSEGELQ